MKHSITLLLILIVNSLCYGQNLNFNDLELKYFLLNEPCVDLSDNPTGQGQFNVDTNNDNEIQLSEALAVKHLYIQDFSNVYDIQSLADLSEFVNLELLEVRVDILEFNLIQLDNLKALHFIDIGLINKIDISNLTNLTNSLRIEGLTTLDTLNIKNGSVSNLFSLFYTIDIKYACIDNITSEYNAFGTFAAMEQGKFPTINCTTLGITDILNEKSKIAIFPNPTDGLIEIKSNHKIDELHIFDITGKEVYQSKNENNLIDLRTFELGVYFLKVRILDYDVVKKVILN